MRLHAMSDLPRNLANHRYSDERECQTQVERSNWCITYIKTSNKIRSHCRTIAAPFLRWLLNSCFKLFGTAGKVGSGVLCGVTSRLTIHNHVILFFLICWRLLCVNAVDNLTLMYLLVQFHIKHRKFSYSTTSDSKVMSLFWWKV